MYYDILEVMIGFLSERYNVSESDGTVSIEFGVIKRSLKTISVQLNFSNGSALCKLLSTQWLHLLLVWGIRHGCLEKETDLCSLAGPFISSHRNSLQSMSVS